MFFPREEEAPELAPARVKGLRLSLNTPVVTTQELAAGPARAAILVHEERDGRPNVTVGLRSLRSGECVLYSFEGDLREHSSLAVGIDAALSFGESMGFLFDDDELEFQGGGAEALRRAVGLWADLMGESPAAETAAETPPSAPSAPAEAPASSATGEGELLLDEIAEPAPEARPKGAEPRATAAEAPEARTAAPPAEPASGPEERPAAPAASPPPARRLSKFRDRGGGAAAETGEGGSPAETAGAAPERTPRRAAALGRLQLVKRRRRSGGRAAAERPGWMLRLFGSF